MDDTVARYSIRAYNNIGMYDFADIIISLIETTHE